MDLQSDIKWIQRELNDIKDPGFIEANKNMLKYRQKVTSERIGIDHYNRELEESIAEINQRNIHSHKSEGAAIKKRAKR